MTSDGQTGRLIVDNVRERRFEVDSNFEGLRLDRFLARRIPRLSRSRAGRIARHGDVRIEPERRVKAGTRLRRGDVVILREELAPERVQWEELSVLGGDDALVVVDKPAGMLVHESASERLNTVQMGLRRHLGFVEAEPVHRIDRETSGVLVCARRSSYVPALREMFATEHPRKIYRALALDPNHIWRPGARRTIEVGLGPDPDSSLSIKMGPGALSARTHFTVRRRLEHPFAPMADLEVRIETGRQHQIRAHLAMAGTPIAGDKLYGYPDAFFKAICARPDDPLLRDRLPFVRHALHAWHITFPHPESGREVTFRAPLPAIWGDDAGGGQE